MDEAYASPDSDGHASLPSPTDTTFDINDVPFRRRTRQGADQPIFESSSFMQSENDDGEDDDDDEDYYISLKALRNPPAAMPSQPPVVENYSTVLTPVNTNDPNSNRRPGKSVSGSLSGQTENIDPAEDSLGKQPVNSDEPELTNESSDGDGPAAPIVVKKYKAQAPDLMEVPGKDDTSLALPRSPKVSAISRSSALDSLTGLSDSVPRASAPKSFVESQDAVDLSGTEIGKCRNPIDPGDSASSSTETVATPTSVKCGNPDTPSIGTTPTSSPSAQRGYPQANVSPPPSPSTTKSLAPHDYGSEPPRSGLVPNPLPGSPGYEQDLQTGRYVVASRSNTTPQSKYEPDYVTRLKQSGNVRRVSMNTPPSASSRSITGTEILADSPKFSSLGSGFSFPAGPLRYSNWESESVSLEFSPILPVEKPRKNGHQPPPNSTNVTPTPNRFGGFEGIPPIEGKGRARSRSDPVDNAPRGAGHDKRLFTPTRLNNEALIEDGERKPRRPEPMVAGANPAQDGILPTGNDVEKRDDDEEGSVSDDGNRGRLWSGFSEDLSFRRGLDPTGTVEPNPELHSLSFDNDMYQLDIPHSVGGESKEASYEDDSSVQQDRASVPKLPQAEVLSDELSKIVQSSDNTPKRSGSGSEEFTAPIISDGSASENPAGENDTEALRTRVLQLEEVVRALSRRDAENRLAGEKQEMLILQWNKRYTEADQTAHDLEGYVERLEREVKKTAEDRDAQIKSHSAWVERMGAQHNPNALVHRRETPMGLEERLRFYEERDYQRQKEAESREGTIAQLRQALDRNGHSFPQPNDAGNDQGLREIARLQEELKKVEETHRAESEAREAKYTNLLGERDGLVRHLQAELDEMVNLMPVDHGSSRMIDEEEADEWLEEKSREISQYYDDGLDQIITELHGTGGRRDFSDAVDEAEMSLRRVAEDAGLEEPLDKATLAAFGIRQLRTEYILLKRLVVESEGRVKDLMQANDGLGRRGEQMRVNIGALEGEKEAIKRTVTEAEGCIGMHLEELETVKAKLAEAERTIRQSTLEKGELVKQTREAKDQLRMSEEDKSALQRLVNDTKQLNEILKTQYTEEEKRAQGFEEEILGLRRRLAEEKDHIGIVETETLALRQQIVELEENLTEKDKLKEELESKVKRMVSLEAERTSFEAKIQQLESGIEGVDVLNRQLKEMGGKLELISEQQSISGETIQQLQQRLSTTEQASRKLSNEKEALKHDVDKAATECKASRGRFAQLLHDTADKEAKWATSRQALESQVHRQASLLEAIFGKVYDAKILAETDGNQAEMVLEVLKRREQQALDTEERTKRYKGAAKKWLKDYQKSKAQVGKLASEVKELRLSLKAEKKSSDEKMGQLILALRRE